MAYDLERKTFTSSYVVFLHQSIVSAITFIKTTEGIITTTPNHPFLTQNGWKAIQPNPQWLQELTIQDKILNSENKYIDIISIETKFQEEQIVYNITTMKPHNYIAFNHVVHNLSAMQIMISDKKYTFEMFPEILVHNIKVLIELRLGIKIEKNYLKVKKNWKIIKLYRIKFNLQIKEQGGEFELKIVEGMKSKNINTDKIVNITLISSNLSIKMPKVCTFSELLNTFAFLNLTLPEDDNQRGWNVEVLKYDQYYFLCQGQCYDKKCKEMKIILHENQQVIFFNKNEQLNNLELTSFLKNIEIRDLQELKNSLITHVDHAKLNFFMDSVIKEINQSKEKRSIYQKFQIHELVAIKVYTSSLIFRKLNIDLRLQKFEEWSGFLKYLIRACQNCSYYYGVVFRGVKNYQNTQLYQVGKKLQWNELSSNSKDLVVAQSFSNPKGMIFQLHLISAKDIEQLSIFQKEKEVLMLPFSQFIVVDVIEKMNSPIEVKLRELPVPRSTKILLWIDDNPQHNYYFLKGLEQELDLSIIFCQTTSDAIDLLNKNKWILLLDDSNLRIVTDMVRKENEIMNFLAGRDFLNFFYNSLKCEQETLVFCNDVQRAKETCKQLQIIGNYKISRSLKDLDKFIRFQ